LGALIPRRNEKISLEPILKSGKRGWVHALVRLSRALVAGAFLANGVPHFVQGICGNKFQTPFARPRGVGESSALVNVI
jgi:hypothetical protein